MHCIHAYNINAPQLSSVIAGSSVYANPGYVDSVAGAQTRFRAPMGVAFFEGSASAAQVFYSFPENYTKALYGLSMATLRVDHKVSLGYSVARP